MRTAAAALARDACLAQACLASHVKRRPHAPPDLPARAQPPLQEGEEGEEEEVFDKTTRVQEGSDTCYGHYDMLMGVRAPDHVFSPIHTWLREVDEVRPTPLHTPSPPPCLAS